MQYIKYVLLVFSLFVVTSSLFAEEKSSVLGETDTNWPGIKYQITLIQRVPNDRLLVGVRIFATAQASPQGTLIGTEVSVPKNANKYDVAAGFYRPLPFSLSASNMVDDLSQQNYPSLTPIAPPGKKYRPSTMLGSLRPGDSLIVALQFAIPPPPPPTDLGKVKQTISFLFTNAKGPISHLPLPPPTN